MQPDRVALHTDRYELTMLDAALQSGVAHHPAVFEAFTRSLPPGRAYGVVAGTARVAEAISQFRFDADTIDHLATTTPLSREALDYLTNYKFRGQIDGYPEGSRYFANSPVLTITGTFGDCVLLETVILSILNHDSAVASAAAHMVDAATRPDGTRPTLIEMGSRRVDPDAAVAAARAAYIAGFDATSNLEAGHRYGIPTVGTSAHAFTLAHPDERAAFDAQISALGVDTTLLVDTYDTCEGIQNAVAAAQAAGASGPGAIRIDSGDLLEEAKFARFMLDALGASNTKITVSGDLDERELARLVAGDAPIDAYGVGTRVATGSGHPTAGFVYKLVAVADDACPSTRLRPVAKRSAGGKATVGGAKFAYLVLGQDGSRQEVITTSPNAVPGPQLQVAYETRSDRQPAADFATGQARGVAERFKRLNVLANTGIDTTPSIMEIPA